jgi:hypothetical protein
MRTTGELDQFFETELKPALQELDALRSQVCRRVVLTSVGLGAGILGGVAIILRGGGGQAPLFGFGLLAVCAVPLAVLLPWLIRPYKQEFKRRIVGALVRFADPGLTYQPEGCIPQDLFLASRLFPHSIDRYRGEDRIAGRIGETEVAFSELHAEYKTTSTDSRGRRSEQWHTIFKGLFFTADFNKAFSGTTVVLPDVAQRALGQLGQKLQGLNATRGQLVKLEDPEFEREFVVYGDDQVEARYLLSTSLMRRILDFQHKTGRQIHVSFALSSVFVALTSSRDMFEPSLLQSIVRRETIQEFWDDLQLAVGIVDDLNLNTRIWTKA